MIYSCKSGAIVKSAEVSIHHRVLKLRNMNQHLLSLLLFASSPLSSYLYLFLLFLKMKGLTFSEQEMLSAFEMGPKTQISCFCAILAVANNDPISGDYLCICILMFVAGKIS